MKKITNAIISRSFILILMVLLSSLLLVVSACDSSTSLETGTLIGRVMLVNDSGNPDLDPVDFFGVRVSLYQLAQIDSVILNAKAVFNSGGFPINQNSEFDHRTHNEVAYTLSNEDGSFSISKIPYGEYNLVVRKAGWGYRYSYNVVIDADMIDYNNYNRTRETLALYPEMVISGAVEDKVNISDWHHLVTSGDVTFSPSSSLYLGPNAIIRIEPGHKLGIMGTLNTNGYIGNLFVITTDYDDTDPSAKHSSTSEYLSLDIDPSIEIGEAGIRGGRFDHSIQAITFSNIEEVNMFNCRFESSLIGIRAFNVKSLNVRESLFIGSDNQNNGMHFFMVDSGCIQGNIFVYSRSGILLEESCAQEIDDNVFIANEYGIELFNSDPSINYNYFRMNSLGISLSGRPSPVIENNYIDSDISVLIGSDWSYSNADPIIHRNNMLAENYYFYLGPANYTDISAQDNYYYTIDLVEIESKIFDKYDYSLEMQEHVSQILFNPICTLRIVDTGPRL